jgi:hypothetical protein
MTPIAPRLFRAKLRQIKASLVEAGSRSVGDPAAAVERWFYDPPRDFCLSLDTDTVAWLDAKIRVARDGVRSGFCPGEAAAMLVAMGGLHGAALLERARV